MLPFGTGGLPSLIPRDSERVRPPRFADGHVLRTTIDSPKVSPPVDVAKLVGDFASVLAFLLVVGAMAWLVVTRFLPGP